MEQTLFSLKKNVIQILILTLFFLTGSAFTTGPRRYEIKTVVIDAGHGGHDTGCLGTTGLEKDIALEVALKLGHLIQENYPQVKVVYTRKTDVFIELHERAEIANRNKADLFICIHANSGGNAFGTETFVLGLHRAEENLAVSKRENSAILMEKDYKTKYDGFDPNSAEANIIFRLNQNTYLQQSLLFAAKVQDQLNDYAGRMNRGVKQAGLLVLARTTMPGVLIETGFLTNRQEEKYLLSSKGQHQIATSIYRAFKEYKIDMEETPDNSKGQAEIKNIEVPKAPQLKEDTLPAKVENKDDKQPVREADKKAPDETVNLMNPLPEQKNKKKEIKTDSGKRDTSNTLPSNQKKDSLSKPFNTAPSEEKMPNSKTDVTPANDKKTNGFPAKEKEQSATPTPILSKNKVDNTSSDSKVAGNEPVKNNNQVDDVFYTIQIGALEKPTAKERERFKKVEDLRERVGDDGMTRFTAGTYFSLDKAILGQKTMRNQGFKDAFVTAYNKNKRITLLEAEKIKKTK